MLPNITVQASSASDLAHSYRVIVVHKTGRFGTLIKFYRSKKPDKFEIGTAMTLISAVHDAMADYCGVFFSLQPTS